MGGSRIHVAEGMPALLAQLLRAVHSHLPGAEAFVLRNGSLPTDAGGVARGVKHADFVADHRAGDRLQPRLPIEPVKEASHWLAEAAIGG
jgi:hypothetical protein